MSAMIVGLLTARLYPSKLLQVKKIILPDAKTVREVEKLNPPVFISISAVNLNLPVAPGIIQNNQWTLYEDKAAWLSTSKTPGKGNVIIYAHNWESLFGKLGKVQIGEEIKIKSTEAGYSYIVAEKREVSPSDTNAVLSNKDQLTLYTCEGTFDKKRLIVIALPKLQQKSNLTVGN